MGMCRHDLVQLMQAQPWGDKSSRYHFSREEEYRHGLKAMIGIWSDPFLFNVLAVPSWTACRPLDFRFTDAWLSFLQGSDEGKQGYSRAGARDPEAS